MTLFASTSLWAQDQATASVNHPEYNWQDQRHSLSVSLGSPSLVSGTSGIITAIFSGFDQNTETRIKLYGSYGIHYGYNVLSWLRVGGSLGYSGWKKTQDGVKKETFNEFSLLTKVDFTYLNRQYVRLYSGLGVGAMLNITNNFGTTDPGRTYSPNVAWAITPIGLEAGGKHVYGLAEINIGTTDLLRAGIGVRL